MSRYSLGLIEVVGLTAAIEAADACLKSANVKLLGVENATGAMLTVKVYGDVGAVRAAVDAGRTRAAQIGRVVSAHVIARPADDTRIFVESSEKSRAEAAKAPEQVCGSEVLPDETEAESSEQEQAEVLTENAHQELSPEQESLNEESEPENVPESPESESGATCNVCGDPACPREKGQPVKLCIHHKKGSDRKDGTD